MNINHSPTWYTSTGSGMQVTSPEVVAQRVADLAADKRAKARRKAFKVIQGGKA